MNLTELAKSNLWKLQSNTASREGWARIFIDLKSKLSGKKDPAGQSVAPNDLVHRQVLLLRTIIFANDNSFINCAVANWHIAAFHLSILLQVKSLESVSKSFF
jgi:hypothetical protein